MPLPSTRRSSLDSFLPQFAPTFDDLTQPAGDSRQAEGTLGGDNGHVDVSNRSSNGNGHVVDLFEQHQNGEQIEETPLAHQNGHVGHAMFETILDPLPNHLNGASPVFAPNGAVVVSAESLAESPSAASDPMSDCHDETSFVSNGKAVASNGESSEPVTASLDSEPEPEESLAPGANGSSARGLELPPHPATGSLFTPYLVTEIRELRNRRARRSWWRRMFG